jgi:hypothetical protein
VEHYTTGENHAQGYLRAIATDPNADWGLAPQRLSSLCDQPSSQEHSTAKAKVGNLTLESRAFAASSYVIARHISIDSYGIRVTQIGYLTLY